MYKVTLMTLDVENTFDKIISKAEKSSFLYQRYDAPCYLNTAWTTEYNGIFIIVM